MTPRRGTPRRMPITASVRSTTDDLREEILLDGRHTVVVDEPEALGGTDTGPSPFELLAGAVAGCVALTVRMYAARKGWELGEVRVDVDLDRECSCCHVTISLPEALEPEQVERLERVARKCPVAKVLDHGLDVRHEVAPGASARA
jgi:putative redox protein